MQSSLNFNVRPSGVVIFKNASNPAAYLSFTVKQKILFYSSVVSLHGSQWTPRGFFMTRKSWLIFWGCAAFLTFSCLCCVEQSLRIVLVPIMLLVKWMRALLVHSYPTSPYPDFTFFVLSCVHFSGREHQLKIMTVRFAARRIGLGRDFDAPQCHIFWTSNSSAELTT